MKKKSLIVGSLIVLFVIFYFGPIVGGYSYSENAAVQYSFPNEEGQIVYEKEFGDKKIVILKSVHGNYVKLISHNLGIFYKSEGADMLTRRNEDDRMRISWSLSQRNNDRYDGMFAVHTTDPSITKVVLLGTDDYNITKNSSLKKVKENATLVVEMDLKNQFAGHYQDMSINDMRQFVFIGLNDHGKIVAVGD